MFRGENKLCSAIMNAYTLISFLLLLLLLQFTSCSSKVTINTNRSFREGDLLISPKKKFALGFFSPGSSRYRYLGIWFHKISVQTVVWVANRNNPINGSSGILSINQQGNLVLHDKNGLVWSTNVSAEVNSTLAVQLLDSGNLVLVQDRKKEVIWQSFDHPTNTLLSGMKLGLNRKTDLNRFLTSWKSAYDPGTGDYSFKVNLQGSPQIFLNHGTRVKWRTGPWPWKIYPMHVNYSFDDNGNEIYLRFVLHDKSTLGRFVLGYSGVLTWSLWHETDKQWKEFWSAHRDQCEHYSKCGANGNCSPTIVNSFECLCLPGYEPKLLSNWQMRDGSGGCIRKRLKTSSVCDHGEGFIKVDKLKLPDSSAAVWVNMSMSHNDCEEECRQNCSCTAYASIPIPGKEIGCLAWYGELIDTRNFLGGSGYDLYVRVDAIELAENAKRTSSGLEMKRMMIISAISAWFFIVIVILLSRCMRKKRRSQTGKKMKSKLTKKLVNSISVSNFNGDALAAVSELEGGSSNNPDFVHFNFSTILAATDNFSSANKIGQGGFGTVYKGRLSNGQEIAVKRMSKGSSQGIEEFRNEVILISKLQHKNLVKLLGCCIKRKEQILVYEYLPNKSLDSFLFDEKRSSLLDWKKRVNIISGIAHGMLYLHQESRLTIIHRDLKSSNILLDAEMNPKISDFGMAKLFNSDQTQGKTKRVVGTYGYMSPEYAVLGKFSAKSDVFSFGVILLEVVSGKKSNSFNHEDSSPSLIGLVWEFWNEGRALEIIDSALKESCKSEEAMRCIRIGLLCVQENAMDRPTMLQVILMLESEMLVPSPKQPAFIFRTSCDAKFPVRDEQTCSINQLTMSVVLTR